MPERLERFPEEACPGFDPAWVPVFRRKCDQRRKLSGVAAVAVRIAIAHAAAAGGVGVLTARRITGRTGRTGFAAAVTHLVAGRIAGCSGLAGHRAAILHALPRPIFLAGA